ncbi:hypothetical protein ACXVUM_16755 [Williamsia sp. SKLECPSW1]
MIDPDVTDTGATPVGAVPDKPVPEGAEADVLEQEFEVEVDDDAYPHVGEIDDE